MTTGPAGASILAARAGPGGMPLALGLSDWLGRSLCRHAKRDDRPITDALLPGKVVTTGGVAAQALQWRFDELTKHLPLTARQRRHKPYFAYARWLTAFEAACAAVVVEPADRNKTSILRPNV